VFTVTGAGADIWGNADAFQSVMQPITGDVQIIARVASIQNTNTYAKAGIMLRQTLTAGSAHVILDLRPNGSIEFMVRSAGGGATTWIASTTQPAPAWLKLTRVGGTVTGYASANGSTWTTVGSTSFSVTPAAYVGLAVTSHDVTRLNTSTFDNVALTGGAVVPALPAPWTNQDVGVVGMAGSSTYSNGVFTVKGAGADIWGSADGFQSVSQPLSGDVQVIARVASVQNTNTYAKAGIMLRNSTAAGAAHVILDLRPNGSVEFMTRSTANGDTTWLASTTQPAPAWLKLTRSGSTVNGYVSANGATWTQIGTASLAFGPSPIAALIVTSHDTTQLNTSTFDNVSAGPLPVVIPAPGTPSAPSPTSGAANLGVSMPLTWASSDATSYDVRFGTTNPPAQVATSISAATYPVSSLQQGVTYYWQIVAKNVTGTTAGPVWAFSTQAPPPSAPSTPAPSAGSSNLPASVALSWTASGAASYDVFVGTTNPPAQAASNLATSNYSASGLAQGTTYFWQVVAKNSTGSTAGPVWSFSTVPATPATPASPAPLSGATNLTGTTIALSWTASGATSYDVAFGTTNPPAAVASNLPAAAYAASGLTAGTTYYWQVIAKNAGGSTAGPVWSFSMLVAPPSAPTLPSPVSSATDVAAAATTLAWTSSGASAYDVYFGTTNPPAQVAADLLASSYASAALQQGTAYYWQVVAKNAGGTVAGPVWSFATVVPPPPPVTGVPSQYSAITDRITRTKPALPSVGAAGSQFNDPAFGSRMLRVTDGSTRPGVANRSYRVPSNAHLNAWNATSTKFFVISNDGTIVPYTFDAQTMTASRINATSSGSGGLTLTFYIEPQFSMTNPDLIFGAGGSNGRTILSYDFGTKTYSTIVNLDTLVPGLSGYVGAVNTGGVPSETLLTFFGGGSQDQHFLALLKPLNGGPSKLMNTVTSTINGVPTATTLNFHIHGMQIDRSGRYVFIYPTGADLAAPRSASQVYLWDTATDNVTAMGGMLPAGHDAAGFGVWINQDCCTSSAWDAAQWQYRSLANPSSTRDMISPVLPVKEIYMADHTTWNNAQPDRDVPVISSTYRYGNNTAPWRAWDDEIIGIDPSSGTVYRFGHHRSNIGSDSNPAAPYFWYEPIANISPDGRWVLFTTNWEKTLGTDAAEGTARQDVFMVGLTPLQ